MGEVVASITPRVRLAEPHSIASRMTTLQSTQGRITGSGFPFARPTFIAQAVALGFPEGRFA